MKSKVFFGFIFLVIIASCAAFFFKLQLPIPSDTIVGLYHPFRDAHAATNPNGLPYKNFLITDPVRQIIPWKTLVVEAWHQMQLPLWNPYQMAGVPLLANFQSSPFYPLNLLLFIHPFAISWSVFVIVQLFLAAVFMYWYLRNLDLHPLAVAFGVLSYVFSGFFVAWFEWGTVVQTALWLPLVLLSIDKVLKYGNKEKLKVKSQKSKLQLKSKKLILWGLVLVLSLTFSFFAGHVQTFFYLFVLSVVYFIFRWILHDKSLKTLVLYLILNTLFLILTAVQWIPTLEFISRSARTLDQSPLTQEGWFLPWQHLAQFIAPDFFGNVTTLNYWGTWNYGELVGYIGIIGLLFAIFSLIARRDKKTWFFAGVGLVAILCMLASPIASLPYNLHVPFLSTAQPTRLMVIVDFVLAVLVALGADQFLRLESGKKRLIFSLIASGIVGISLLFLWIVVLAHGKLFGISATDLVVAKHNLILPTAILCAAIILLILSAFVKRPKLALALLVVVLLIHSFDMVRFFQKFEPFTPQQYFFENTKVTQYLQQHTGDYRIAAMDRRIFPPNFATYYHLQSIEGYDPLYLQSYAEFISALERGKPDIRPPFGFNRIITPHNIDSPLFDLLSVKYVLSFDDVNKPGYKKVIQEGLTKVYQTKNPLPRTFFVKAIVSARTPEDQIRRLFAINHHTTAIVSGTASQKSLGVGTAQIKQYSPNDIQIVTHNQQDGYLVLLDVYYPTWKAFIDGKQTPIYRTDYTFRGLVVPKGTHTIELKDFLL